MSSSKHHLFYSGLSVLMLTLPIVYRSDLGPAAKQRHLLFPARLQSSHWDPHTRGTESVSVSVCCAGGHLGAAGLGTSLYTHRTGAALSARSAMGGAGSDTARWGGRVGQNGINWMYLQTSSIRRSLIGNQIVDHSDVVGAAPVGAAPITSSFVT